MPKKTKSDAKSKTAKIPKRIAGVKVPKDLRKKGEALLEKANSPLGRELIASGLSAAVMAVAASRSKTVRAGAEQAKEGAEGAAKAGAEQAQVLTDTIGNAAEAVMKRVFGGPAKG